MSDAMTAAPDAETGRRNVVRILRRTRHPHPPFAAVHPDRKAAGPEPGAGAGICHGQRLPSPLKSGYQ